MSPRRWGWLLLSLCAVSMLLASGDRAIAWRSWALSAAALWTAALWLCALASPSPLRWHPAAGAWMAWSLWRGVCVLRSGYPVERAELWVLEASAILLFILAHAWWASAHRRAWAAGLWVVTPFAILFWPRPLAAALVASAAAGAWAIWMESSTEGPRWKGELALAGLAALAFVVISSAWTAFFACFVSTAMFVAFERRGGRAIAAVVALALVGGAVLRRFSPNEPFFLGIFRETGWIGLGLFACAAMRSLPENPRRLGWEGRGAAAVLYALLAEACLDPAAGVLPLQVVFFSAVACASPWARAREEGGLAKLADESHEWTKPRWAGALGLAVCLALIFVHHLQRTAAAAAADSAPQARVAALRRLAALEPGDSWTRLRMAQELLQSQPGRISAALAWLDEAIRLEPRNALFIGLKANLFFSVGDWRRGGFWAQKAVSIEPNFAAARLMLAESMARGDEFEQAKEQLRLARRLFDRGLASAAREGIAHWDEGQYDRVLKLSTHAR